MALVRVDREWLLLEGLWHERLLVLGGGRLRQDRVKRCRRVLRGRMMGQRYGRLLAANQSFLATGCRQP